MGKYINPSPAAGFLYNLFGIGAVPKKGGFKASQSATKRGYFPYATPLFGPASSVDIGSYLNLTGSNAFTRGLGAVGRTGDFSLLPEELYGPYRTATTTLDDLIARGRPLVNALIETGMPVDIGGVTRAAASRYRNEILPIVSEMYNPAQGTAFQNIAAREAQLLADELGKLDYAAQEAARARQIQGISVGAPALAGLTSARIGLPGATLAEAQELSQLTDPGGRLLAALTSLLGTTQQPADFIRGSGAPAGSGGGSGTGEILSGVSSLVGIVGGLAALCWVADELFGVNDMRTWLARAWCYAHPDHPFVQRYRAEGREWAAWLRANPWAKPIVQPTWEWMAEQALTQ